MKKVLAIVLTLLLLVPLVGCASESDLTETTTAAGTTTTTATTTTISTTTTVQSISSIESTTTTVQQIGIGGDDWDYTRCYLLTFSIEGRLSRLADETEFDQWNDTFEHYDRGGSRSANEYNVYEFIQEFDVTREQVEEICQKYKARYPDDDYFTDEQIDVLFTGTRQEVYGYFANPHAIYIGPGADEVYPPKWLAEHTAEEYLAVGITYDILNAKLDDVLYDHLPDTPRQHILAQLEALKNME